MATLRKSALFLGPTPWSDEPSVEVSLALSAEELALAKDSALALAKTSAHLIAVPPLNGSDLLSVGQFIAELARSLLNEAGDVLATANARLSDDGARLTLGFRHPQASLLALEAAARLALGAGRVEPSKVAQSIEAFWKKAQTLMPDPQATVLLRHSTARGIPVRPFDLSLRLWLHGWGSRSELVFEGSPRGDSRVASRISSDKSLTKPVAVAAGFRILPSLLVRDARQLEAAARAIGFPCVAKPTGGMLSKGVTVGITDLQGLREAYRVAQGQSKGPVLIERYAPGEPHRIMVQRGKLWKAILRPRPCVVGDGVTSVTELAKARNDSLRQVIRPFSITRPTPLDEDFVACLARQGLAPASVPAVGAKVIIREIPLLSKGASNYEDVTARVHPEIRAAAERLAALLGAASMGIDFVSVDIGRADGGYFLEANLCPELRLLRSAGLSDEDIGRGILGENIGRIPSVLVIAPLAQHAGILGLAPKSASLGWTDGRQVGIGSSVLPTSVRLPHDGVDLLVRNPSVESLLVLCDPEALVSSGLPLDRVDTAYIAEGTNLAPEWDAALRRRSGQVRSGPPEAAFA